LAETFYRAYRIAARNPLFGSRQLYEDASDGHYRTNLNGGPDACVDAEVSCRTATENFEIWQIDRSGEHPIQFHKSAATEYGRVAPISDGNRISFSSDRDDQNAVCYRDVCRGELKW
jgi:hypothetical protein